MINKKTGFERKDDSMKVVGKKELEDIKQFMESKGETAGADKALRLIHTIELLSGELAKAHDGKSVLLSERDTARKALAIAMEALLAVRSGGAKDFFSIPHALGKIQKLMKFSGLPLDLLQKLAEFK